MKWDAYRKKLVKEANKQGKNKRYIDALSKYAKNLFDKNLPIITEPRHFSSLVGFEHSYICRMAYSPQHFYRSFQIEKKNGKKRRIDEPLLDLKYVQRWVLKEILMTIHISPYAKAYVLSLALN